MRFSTFQAALGSASILFSAQPVAANLGHRQAHAQYARRHGHGHSHSRPAGELVGAPKVARKATCTLPDDPDLVHIPGAANNGFAMSPDQSCEDGTWCPIACVPGKVMAQWKPNTKYTYPESMDGGLYCNGGTAEKPFENSPYCVDGTGTVKAVNKAGSVVAFCQTVLPGNEAMLIPTEVTDTVTLAVPGPDYWAGTAAHYYINPPGTSTSKGCVWGTPSEPVGNWSPYVAGANTLASGETFVKIAWNPEFLGEALAKTTPTFGLKIECPGGGCNGLPCTIDPSKGGVGGLDSPDAATGVGNAAFCVVTVPKGGTANIVVFNTDGSQGSAPPSSSKAPEKPTTSAAKPTTHPPSTSSAPPTTTSTTSSSTTVSSAPSSSSSDIFVGGVFQEQTAQGQSTHYPAPNNATASAGTGSGAASASPTADAVSPVSATPTNEGAAAEGGSAIAGLVVALIAAAALF
ncbi:b638f745-59df-4872-aa2c-ce0742081764 [Thermothielavioides terrestris]|uniref:B638f745-59df-4872-aa2c-ce0742081764 n=1 Tax=Thermothielavioides terrestris TaxID=2587410 RepID=A0A3S4EVF8_9PEZI|nr:b638f745-59df-4872-aa2c-ce0742081764 [Thermothielavioides terrestris]